MRPPPLLVQAFYHLSSYFPERDSLFMDRFDDLVEGLASAQVEAAFSDATRNLVLAGAGSGKTHVLTRRVAHLIRKGVPLERIRVITFTRKATQELTQRLQALTGVPEKKLGTVVSTIHKLAIRTLAKVRPDLRYCQAEMSLPHDPVRKAWDEALKGELKREKKLWHFLFELVQPPDGYDPYLLHEKQNFHPEPHVPTANGLMVRSGYERKVADSLSRLGIEFEYEKPVLWAESVFRPDFYLPSVDAYIEVLGLWDHPIKGPAYRESWSFKKAQAEKYGYGYAFLTLYPADMEDEVERKISAFLQKLRRYTQRKLRRHEKRIRAMAESIPGRAAQSFYELHEALLNNEMSPEELWRQVRYPASHVVPYFEQIRMVARRRLAEQGLLPGAELFHFLAQRHDAYGANDVEYVFIDEFQDVQPLQLSFLAPYLRKSFFVIGDVRQSIYGFLGGSPHFLESLRRYFKGVRELALELNYRSQRNIVELGNAFAVDFPGLVAHQQAGPKVQILVLDDELRQADQAYRYVKGQVLESPLMVLGRYNDSPICRAYQKLVKRHPADAYLTFHGSKGAEAESVLVVGCNGFPDGRYSVPSENRDPPLKAAVHNRYAHRNTLAEERRLFYVALTRARQRLFIACQANALSPFVQELQRWKAFVHVVRLGAQ